jgi:site-specific recombinase XerD
MSGVVENHGEVAPQTIVASHRKTNSCHAAASTDELRTREYLTDAEVAKLTEAAKANRYGHRDATMVLLAYRHGLRVSGRPPLGPDRLQ